PCARDAAGTNRHSAASSGASALTLTVHGCGLVSVTSISTPIAEGGGGPDRGRRGGKPRGNGLSGAMVYHASACAPSRRAGPGPDTLADRRPRRRQPMFGG